MATQTRVPPPSSPTRQPGMPPDWRAEVVGASGLNIIAGIWLIISPFVLSYHSGDAYWNPIVFGAIVALLALARVGGAYREPWLSWINAATGVWLFISAFWLADSNQAQWNVWILGIVVFVLALVSASASESAVPPHGGGPGPGTPGRG